MLRGIKRVLMNIENVVGRGKCVNIPKNSKITNIHLGCFKLKHIKEFPLNETGKVSYNKLENLL